MILDLKMEYVYFSPTKATLLACYFVVSRYPNQLALCLISRPDDCLLSNYYTALTEWRNLMARIRIRYVPGSNLDSYTGHLD